jgi:hypothetical protein
VVRRAGLATLLALALSQTAQASDEPVTLAVQAPAAAALGLPFRVTTSVGADAGALDPRSAPLRIRVRLASACAGTFDDTAGITVLDAELAPVPVQGKAYTRRFSRSLTVTRYGTLTACAFLEEAGDHRMFAFDSSTQIAVTKRCTAATRRARTSAKRVSSARAKLRHAHGSAGKAKARRRLAGAQARLKHVTAARRKACDA